MVFYDLVYYFYYLKTNLFPTTFSHKYPEKIPKLRKKKPNIYICVTMDLSDGKNILKFSLMNGGLISQFREQRAKDC